MRTALLLVVVCLGLCLAAELKFNSKQDIEDYAHFREWMNTYNKKYDTAQESTQRFRNFQANLRRLEESRKGWQRNPAFHNVTQFFDMTPQEFRSYPCGVNKLSELSARRPDFKINHVPMPDFSAPPPASWDWTTKGAVTPIKNQGECGSCWAFSTIGNMEGVWFLSGKKLTGLSEEQIVDCSTTDYGCSGGWPFWAMADMDASPYNGQIDTEAAYPYTAENGNSGTCAFSSSKVGATLPKYKNYCNEQTAACGMTQVMQLLVQYGPLSVCLNADSMMTYTSGTDHPSSCDPSSIDHCVTMVGYGTDNSGNPFWKIKNSWGTTWGESGYYYLYRDNSNNGAGVCGITSVITIASV